MNRKTLLPLAFLASTQSGCTGSPPESAKPSITYPLTNRVEVVENHFGKAVSDPYRWLENDVRSDKDVAGWIEAQNRTTAAYLDTLPSRDAFRKSLTSLYDYECLTAPHKRGNLYFYTRKPGLANQAALYVREGVDGVERVLVDPKRWAEDGTSALVEWAASHDGRHVAYAVQDGGSNWRTIKVLDVDTGKERGDEVKRARYTAIAWVKDGSGFFYSHYPEPKTGEGSQAGVTDHAIYFHKLGTPQSQDRLLYATPDHPSRLNAVQVTDDGRYAVISSSDNLSTSAVMVVDLANADWKPRKLVDNLDNKWGVLANVGSKLFFSTDKGAERFKIITIDLAASEPGFKDFLPEQESVLMDGHLVGGRLLVSYLVDAKTEVMRYKLDGTPDGVLELPGIGSVNELRGDPEGPESFFVFTSFNTLGTVYRYDVATGKKSVWVEPDTKADLERIVVDQLFYKSKDGTRVPMFVIRRKDVTGLTPTLLWGYGGYTLSITPSYSAVLLGWVDQGGVLAIPNARGGGEYGTAWHQAGRREKKQNVFDDFIAAAEHLHASKIAPANGIVIHGESNGGLPIGAVTNQRPDLFAAALPGVGVMDMLRFNKFTSGRQWVDEYGDPAREADFNTLLAYSPYHDIKPGKEYPAILATTADTDDRVVPAHTFKYVAALQAADPGSKPRLVRIETRTGHGDGKPTAVWIEETADMWAFAARWTGLDMEAAQ